MKLKKYILLLLFFNFLTVFSQLDEKEFIIGFSEMGKMKNTDLTSKDVIKRYFMTMIVLNKQV